MIISRTPYRISFFGGGTDYPAWYRAHGGAVLAATVDKYCYLSCRYLPPFFEHRLRVVYSKIESCQDREEVQHPAVREVLRYLDIERGVEIHHDGDLPARSGMGSSSAFTVGLLHALHALKGEMPNRHQLALEGIYLEQERLRETVGSQDQVLAAYGGFNHVGFATDGSISVRPMTLGRQRVAELNDHLMLFFTGIKRTASEVASSYVRRIERKDEALRRMGAMVDEGIAILTGRSDLSAFGKLLHDAWKAKRSLGGAVSNGQVDEIYQEALRAGALGGKITGAGGGGFLLLFVHPSLHAAVRERLSRLLHIPFRLEFSGSQIVFFDPEEDWSAQERDREAHKVARFSELKPERRRRRR